MTSEASNKFIAIIGSLGWVLAALFIILFFIVLRPSTFLDGQEDGAEAQKNVDREKVSAFFSQGLQEGERVIGELIEASDDSVLIEVKALPRNPLDEKTKEPFLQTLLINQDTFISLNRIYEVPQVDLINEQENQIPSLASIGVENLKQGIGIQYVPKDTQAIYGTELELAELHLYVAQNEAGEYVSIVNTQNSQQ